jgi:MoxR-like ATPase
MDRFLFKITLGYPLRSELIEILDRTTGGTIPEATKTVEREEVLELRTLVREVPIPTEVRDYAVTLVMATHPGESGDHVNRFVRYGASPRAAQALVLGAKAIALLDGRYSVSYDDIRRVALPALRHRLILTFEGEAEGITTDAVVREILDNSTP